MADLYKQLESGIEYNGKYQRIIPILLYIDIPIQIVINKLELVDNKANKFFKFLNSSSPIIINWTKSNPDKTLIFCKHIWKQQKIL